MIIYKITHKLSGKCYIGQTRYPLKSRWNQHCHPNSDCVALKRAIAKYGADAFSVDLLAEYKTNEDLNTAEEYYISFYNSLSPYGYNLQAGGYGHVPSEETREKMARAQLGRKHKEESKRKIGEAQIGEKHHMFGKHHTVETRKKLSLAGKGKQAGERHPMYGKHHTEEAKRKISVALKGKPKPRKKL